MCKTKTTIYSFEIDNITRTTSKFYTQLKLFNQDKLTQTQF
jgi:hypothetical protein